jgi:hypothetical protein
MKLFEQGIVNSSVREQRKIQMILRHGGVPGEGEKEKEVKVDRRVAEVEAAAAAAAAEVEAMEEQEQGQEVVGNSEKGKREATDRGQEEGKEAEEEGQLLRNSSVDGDEGHRPATAGAASACFFVRNF